MKIELSPFEVRTLLNWWSSSRRSLYGSLEEGLGTLREITLVDRLECLLDRQRDLPEGKAAAAIRDAEKTADRVLREETARAQPELQRHQHEVVFAGVVHTLSPDDARYWSLADLQIEPIGAERPSYRFFSSDLPVWRDGASRVGPDGETLRQEIRSLLEQWLTSIRRG